MISRAAFFIIDLILFSAGWFYYLSKARKE